MASAESAFNESLRLSRQPLLDQIISLQVCGVLDFCKKSSLKIVCVGV
jgi:hypothetical protein